MLIPSTALFLAFRVATVSQRGMNEEARGEPEFLALPRHSTAVLCYADCDISISGTIIAA